uniref:Putative polyketide synthase n=1 Tax=Hematodinium sp. SG-2015 TaxID=1649283 RepID=A0A0F7C9F6_9DINO|nr:putative polyketide synthase [Hematodinium sp. SG-2015]|eukprot:GEMP01000028.1.p1 GENE.GEMP01000028.1~~GEMP01000028.1.p1  ORF type:complete len:4231 (-),score=975.68 GEMP01000028.1:1849-14541(-)
MTVDSEKATFCSLSSQSMASWELTVGDGSPEMKPPFIVGMACRFPGAKNHHEFWDNLASKTVSIGPLPKPPSDANSTKKRQHRPRWDCSLYDATTFRAGYMDDSVMEQFDNDFFSISPKEAIELDVSQRLALEVTVEALRDAGIPLTRLRKRKVGVFVGASNVDSSLLHFHDPNTTTGFTMLSTVMCMIANRISHFLDITGPSFTLDTACSSSAYAFSLAETSLANKECEIAIVIGVNALLAPAPFVAMSRANMLSPTGECFPFDERANGMVRGEGCGAVILCPDAEWQRWQEQSPMQSSAASSSSSAACCPPLSVAPKVYCRVLGTSTNEDGNTSSITQPNPEQQMVAIQDVMTKARIAADQVAFFEAHGTGTSVGDPVEMKSMTQTVAAQRSSCMGPLIIGSVKGNIGHLEPTSGIAAIIKSALMCAKGVRLPQPSFAHFNKKVALERSCDKSQLLHCLQSAEPFPEESPCVLVNSFGFGGANCCIVLGRPHTQPEQQLHKRIPTMGANQFPLILVLSAHRRPLLDEREQQWRQFIDATSPVPSGLHMARTIFADACMQRHNDPHRRVIIGHHGVHSLWLDSSNRMDATSHNKASVTLCFGGQGSHFPLMGRDLYTSIPLFRHYCELWDRIYQQISGVSLLQLGWCASLPSSMLDVVNVTMPCIVLFQLAIVDLLTRGLGIHVDAVVGHSVGEIACLYASAPTWGRENAARVTYARAMAQKEQRVGAMCVWAEDAQMTLQRITDACVPNCTIACDNATTNVTISGSTTDIATLVKYGKERNVRCATLPILRAYHSSDVPLDVFDRFAQNVGIATLSSACAYASTVTGTWLHEEAATLNDYGITRDAATNAVSVDPKLYLRRGMRDTVQFRQAATLAAARQGCFVEVSPKPITQQYMTSSGMQDVAAVASRSCEGERQFPDTSTLLETVGKLFVRGVPIHNWSAFEPDTEDGGMPPVLPPYRLFQDRQPGRRHWMDCVARKDQLATPAAPVPVPVETAPIPQSVPLAASAADDVTLRPRVFGRCTVKLSPHTHPSYADHKVGGAIVLPGAASAVYFASTTRTEELQDVRFLQQCTLFHGNRPISLFIDRKPAVAPGYHDSVTLTTRENTDTICVVASALVVEDADRRLCSKPRLDDAWWTNYWKQGQRVSATSIYDFFDKYSSIKYGQAFRCVADFRVVSNDEGLALLRLPTCARDQMDSLMSCALCPSLLDSAMHATLFLLPVTTKPFFPVSIDTLWLPIKKRPEARAVTELRVHIKVRRATYYDILCDIDGYGEDGTHMLAMRGLKAIMLKSKPENKAGVYSISWQPVGVPDPCHYLSQDSAAKGVFGDDDLDSLVRLVLTAATRECNVVRVLVAASREDKIEQLRAQWRVLEDEFPTQVHVWVGMPSVMLSSVGGSFDVVIAPTESLDALQSWRGDANSPAPNPILLGAWRCVVPQGGLIAQRQASSHYGMVMRGELEYVDAAGECQDMHTDSTFTQWQTRHDVLVLDENNSVEDAKHAVHAPQTRVIIDARGSLAEASSVLSNVLTRWKENNTWFYLVFVLFNENMEPEKMPTDQDAALAALIPGWARVARMENPEGVSVFVVTMSKRAWLTGEGRKSIAALVEGGIGVCGRGQPFWREYDLELRTRTIADGQEHKLQWATWRTALHNAPAKTKKNATEPKAVLHHYLAQGDKAVYQLQVSRPGQLQSLEWRPVAAAFYRLAPLEVRLRMHTVSLNFKDVAIALALMGREWSQRVGGTTIGYEGLGFIEECGADVATTFPDLVTAKEQNKPVLVLAATQHLPQERSLFSTQAISLGAHCVPLLAPIPAQMPHPTVIDDANNDLTVSPFDTLAGYLGVFGTAYYALKDVARLRKSDVVLIHSALGGVGQAALQVCRHLGATVIASAGTIEKRARLKQEFAANAQWGGVVHVIDSRAPEQFKKEIMQATNNRGVDVVLNSLSGRGLIESLRCCSPLARFLEIGKKDMWSDPAQTTDGGALPLELLQRNISFHSVQMDLLFDDSPTRASIVLRECIDALVAGHFVPLESSLFAADKAQNAFNLLAKGKHMGKVLVRMPPTTPTHDNTHSSSSSTSTAWIPPKMSSDSPKALFDGHGTYVFSGGTRGLGLQMALWAAKRGARHILLVGSSRVRTNEEDDAFLSAVRDEVAIESNGSGSVTVAQCDLAVLDAVRTLISACNPVVRGVFHLATQYSEQSATSLSDFGFHHMAHVQQTIGAKWLGALHLRQATVDLPLTHFVTFSSLGTAYGNPNQALYHASNLALERLSLRLRSSGQCLHALTVELPIMMGAGRLSLPQHSVELKINTQRQYAVVEFDDLMNTHLEPLLELPYAAPPVSIVTIHDWNPIRNFLTYTLPFAHLFPEQPTSVPPQSTACAPTLAVTADTQPPPPAVAAPAPSQHVVSAVDSTMATTQKHTHSEVLDRILSQTALILGIDSITDIDTNAPLHQLGVDSLAAAEMVNFVRAQYNVPLSQTDILERFSVLQIVDSIVEKDSTCSLMASPVPDTPYLPTPSHQTSARGSPTGAMAATDAFVPGERQTGDIVQPTVSLTPQAPAMIPTLAPTVKITSSAQVDREAVTHTLLQQISIILGIDEMGDIDRDAPLHQLGVDSLAAVELVNFVRAEYDVPLSQSDVLERYSTQDIVDKVATWSEHDREGEYMVAASQPSTITPASSSPTMATFLVETQSPLPNAPVRSRPATMPVASTATFAATPLPTSMIPPLPNMTPIPLAPSDTTSTPSGITVSTLLIPPLFSKDAISALMNSIITARGTIIVLTQTDPNGTIFCDGMDLSARDAASNSDAKAAAQHDICAGLDVFARLSDLLDAHDMPIVTTINGRVRGGGMLFPSVAHCVMACRSATFGFPEVHVGMLPAVVSVAAAKRIHKVQLQRLMSLGCAFDAAEAQRLNFVDEVYDTPEALQQALTQTIRSYQRTQSRVALSQSVTALPAPDTNSALIAMGKLFASKRPTQSPAQPPLVSVSLSHDERVAIIQLDDAEHSNAMNPRIANDFERAVAILKMRYLDTVRAVVVQGSGAHFCVGMNPTEFSAHLRKSVPEIAHSVYQMYSQYFSIRSLNIPIVICAHGNVVGGGLGLTAIGDYRICASVDNTTSFCLGNASRGVCPGLLLSEHLPQMVGRTGDAMAHYLTEDALSPADALRLGIVQEISPTVAHAQQRALQVATEFAQFPQEGVMATLQLMRPKYDSQRLAKECVGMARCASSGTALSHEWRQKFAQKQLQQRQGASAALASSWLQQQRALGPQQVVEVMPTRSLMTTKTVQRNTNSLPTLLSVPDVVKPSRIPPVVDPKCAHYMQDVHLASNFSLGVPRNLNSDARTVFLTGGNGFLGSHILISLLDNPAITRIICLIRASDVQAGMQRIISALEMYDQHAYANADILHSRVEVVCGCVTSPLLGLASQELYTRYACESDVVIHNAALVNFSSAYEGELLRVNVGGVRNALLFAAHHTVSRFVHVSSMSVFGLPYFDGNPEHRPPDASECVPTTGRCGYPLSKWVGEQIVWLAQEQHGMPCAVIRPGCIMGHSRTGACNVRDWFFYYLLACVRTGSGYQTKQVVDMTSVDDVAHMVTHHALHPTSPTPSSSSNASASTTMKAWHARSPTVLTMDGVAKILCERGYSVTTIDFSEWSRVMCKFARDIGPLYHMLGTVDWEGVELSPEKRQLLSKNNFRHLHARDLYLSGVDMTHEHLLDDTVLLVMMLDWMVAKKYMPSVETSPSIARDIRRLPLASVSPREMTTRKSSSSTIESGTRVDCHSNNGGTTQMPKLVEDLNVGIHAIEMYIPQYFVSQVEMEQYDNCAGKYTKGLGQTAIGYCLQDEDSVSYALTCTMRLLERVGISIDMIGRVEVGTESQTDRSKSIKSMLVDLLVCMKEREIGRGKPSDGLVTSGFNENSQDRGLDVEGVDNVHACYGGTAALLNSILWCQNDRSEGKYALVVCTDIAVQPTEYRFMTGSGAVCMLIGRDAPLVMLPEHASHMANTWDFYKPVNWPTMHAVMKDGKHSVDCYIACLDNCQQRLSDKITRKAGGDSGGVIDHLRSTDHILFHCTSIYLCRRGFDRWYRNACSVVGKPVALKERQDAYERMCLPSTYITENNGSAYTASCYVNLYSLIDSIGAENMVGRTITVFSYGSGSASTIYRLQARGPVSLGQSANTWLSRRRQRTAAEFVATTVAYSEALYGKFDWTPEERCPDEEREDGVFYLRHVDTAGVRIYQRHARRQ